MSNPMPGQLSFWQMSTVFPEPTKAQQLKVKLEHQTLYYHKLGTPQSADVRVYARPDHPSWFVFGGVDESGRYLFISTSPGVVDTPEWKDASGSTPMPQRVRDQISNRLRLVCRNYVRA